MIRQYRKKPVIIHALQWTGENSDEVKAFIGSSIVLQWTSDKTIGINTLEGPVYAKLMDWIIRGIEGEFYPCKPLIFTQTYELVEEKKNAKAQRNVRTTHHRKKDDAH